MKSKETQYDIVFFRRTLGKRMITSFFTCQGTKTPTQRRYTENVSHEQTQDTAKADTRLPY